MDLGLLQRDVAERIGVTASTVNNWESGRMEPGIRHLPQIIDYLGYVPFECPEDILGRLLFFKKLKGLNYEKLGEATGIHFELIEDWATGRTKPTKRNIERIRRFLDDSNLEQRTGPG
jgi:transcriptional regulator with XRE-family HTH domain